MYFRSFVRLVLLQRVEIGEAMKKVIEIDDKEGMESLLGVKIEKGIPMGKPEKRGKWSMILSSMAFGDSFVVSKQDAKRIESTLSHHKKKIGCKVSMREIGDGEVRVWKVPL